MPQMLHIDPINYKQEFYSECSHFSFLHLLLFQVILQENPLSNKNAVLLVKLLIHNKMRDDQQPKINQKNKTKRRQEPNRMKSKIKQKLGEKKAAGQDPFLVTYLLDETHEAGPKAPRLVAVALQRAHSHLWELLDSHGHHMDSIIHQCCIRLKWERQQNREHKANTQASRQRRKQ